MGLRRSVLLGLAVLASGCEFLQWQALRAYLAANPNLEVTDGARTETAERGPVRLVPLVDDLEFPWDLAFPSDSEALVTEKPGRLSRIDLATGRRTLIRGVPEVAFVGQGGLLGVEVDPDFATNQRLYVSYAVALPGERYSTRLARARLAGDALVEPEVLLTAEPAMRGNLHFGGAIEFDREGHLYLAVGERYERSYAQDLGSHLGKLLRLWPDGSVPEDNPFAGVAGARPEIFTLGHRNPQGLALQPETGALFASEHGPQGGDEINRIRAGRNYGWPIISHGQEYEGGPVGVGTQRAGLEQPVHHWTASFAPGGIGFYTGDALSGWRGNLFASGLRATRLERLELDGERVSHAEPLFAELWQRVRAVRESPARELYVLTENGVLFRIEPGAPPTPPRRALRRAR